jgi:hypothetical protein
MLFFLKKNQFVCKVCCLCVLVLAGAQVMAADEIHHTLAYELKYRASLVPSKQGAMVTISVDKGELLKHLRFSNSRGIYSNIRANGKLTITGKQVDWGITKRRGTALVFCPPN